VTGHSESCLREQDFRKGGEGGVKAATVRNVDLLFIVGVLREKPRGDEGRWVGGKKRTGNGGERRDCVVHKKAKKCYGDPSQGGERKILQKRSAGEKGLPHSSEERW